MVKSSILNSLRFKIDTCVMQQNSQKEYETVKRVNTTREKNPPCAQYLPEMHGRGEERLCVDRYHIISKGRKRNLRDLRQSERPQHMNANSTRCRARNISVIRNAQAALFSRLYSFKRFDRGENSSKERERGENSEQRLAIFTHWSAALGDSSGDFSMKLLCLCGMYRWHVRIGL